MLKMEYRFISFIILSLPISLHLIAFSMLYRTRYVNKFNQVQRLYLLNLSLSEMCFCVLSIIKGNLSKESTAYFYVAAWKQFAAVMMFLLSYLMLTIDRFLIAYLNLRYPAVVSLQRTYRLYALCYGISCLVSMAVCLFHPQDYLLLSRHATTFIWVPGDIIFVVIAIFTYTYIFLTRKKMRHNIVKNDVAKSGHCSLKTSSTLLILSFVIFYLIPDVILSCLFLASDSLENYEHYTEIVSTICFSSGYSIDAFIYIFSLKSISIPSCKEGLFSQCFRVRLRKFTEENTLDDMKTELVEVNIPPRNDLPSEIGIKSV